MIWEGLGWGEAEHRGSAGRDGAAPGAAPPLQQPPELWGGALMAPGESCQAPGLRSQIAPLPGPLLFICSRQGLLGLAAGGRDVSCCPLWVLLCVWGAAPSETSGLCCCFKR